MLQESEVNVCVFFNFKNVTAKICNLNLSRLKWKLGCFEAYGKLNIQQK